MVFFLFLKGRGTVATGRIEQGIIKVGEEVEILGLSQVSVHECWVYSVKVKITVCYNN